MLHNFTRTLWDSDEATLSTSTGQWELKALLIRGETSSTKWSKIGCLFAFMRTHFDTPSSKGQKFVISMHFGQLFRTIEDEVHPLLESEFEVFSLPFKKVKRRDKNKTVSWSEAGSSSTAKGLNRTKLSMQSYTIGQDNPLNTPLDICSCLDRKLTTVEPSLRWYITSHKGKQTICFTKNNRSSHYAAKCWDISIAADNALNHSYYKNMNIVLECIEYSLWKAALISRRQPLVQWAWSQSSS